MKIGSFNSFNNHPTPSRMPFYTFEVNWPNCLIKEGIQYPERWSESWSDDIPSIEELTSSCHHSTPIHHHHVTPLSPMDNPIIIPLLSSLCRSPSYLSCRLAEMQTILVLGVQSRVSEAFGHLNRSQRKGKEAQRLQELL